MSMNRGLSMAAVMAAAASLVAPIAAPMRQETATLEGPAAPVMWSGGKRKCNPGARNGAVSRVYSPKYGQKDYTAHVRVKNPAQAAQMNALWEAGAGRKFAEAA